MKWTPEAMAADYDWTEAFTYAGGVSQQGPQKPPVAFCGVTAEPFSVADIAEVICARAGERDERDWRAVVRLKDGRFGFLTAGCDYTGWDCRASGSASVSDTLENLLQYGLTVDERDWYHEQRAAEPS